MTLTAGGTAALRDGPASATPADNADGDACVEVDSPYNAPTLAAPTANTPSLHLVPTTQDATTGTNVSAGLKAATSGVADLRAIAADLAHSVNALDQRVTGVHRLALRVIDGVPEQLERIGNRLNRIAAVNCVDQVAAIDRTVVELSDLVAAVVRGPAATVAAVTMSGGPGPSAAPVQAGHMGRASDSAQAGRLDRSVPVIDHAGTAAAGPNPAAACNPPGWLCPAACGPLLAC